MAITVGLALLAASVAVAAQQPDEHIVVPLDQGIPDVLVRHAVEVAMIPSGPQQGLKVRFGVTDWPGKLKSESDFAEHIRREESGLTALPAVHQDKM